MDFRLLYIVIFSVFWWAAVLGNEDNLEKKCNLNDVTNPNPGCSKNETCMARRGATSGYCRCKPGYSNKNNQGLCLLLPIPITPSPVIVVTTASPEPADIVYHSSFSTGAITAAVLVPLLLASAVLLVLLGRRYQCFERLQLLQGRRYEEVRIGQEDEDDDPPLA